jgi:hypothetical protein
MLPSRLQRAIEQGAAYRQASIRLGQTPLSISQLGHDLAEIYRDMEVAITELLESVGSVRGATMTLCPKVSSAALELQGKCWGPQWSTVCSELVASHLFPAVEVLLSLCSAFLLIIFDRECCSACIEFRSQLGSGANGKTIAPPPEECKWRMTQPNS